MKPVKTKQICLYLPEEDYNAIKIAAEDEDRSMSAYIYSVLEKYFDENENNY